jgi:hypothetical protein
VKDYLNPPKALASYRVGVESGAPLQQRSKLHQLDAKIKRKNVGIRNMENKLLQMRR